MRSDSYPRYQTGSGWNALLPERQPQTRMPAERHVATAVIGAGYTGLAAARRVAELEPDRPVLLLDAGEVGEGASGRNSGFLGVAPQQPLGNRHGDAMTAAARQVRIYRAGVAWLKSLVETHGIACNWNETMPRFHAAATPAGAKRIAGMIARYNNWGITARAVDQDELERRIGTRYYRAGMTYGDHAFVQPAALVRGLAAALPANVTLVERLPVEAVNGSGPFRITTPTGEVTADRVIIASNAHARSFGLLKGRLFAIYTHGGMTPVLPASELAKLGEDPLWGVLPAHQLGTTSRKIEGGRFLIRAGDSYETQPSTKAIRNLLTKLYRNRYPGMASYELEHVWTGATAITGNGGLFFGEIRKGLFCAAGCNGSGVVRGSINGKLLAEMACGSQSDLLSDRLSLEGPNWLPPEPARRIGVTTTIAVQAVFAGGEI
jgi:glycine/D-amino acid oxidase-like deaminating enzyme